MVVVVVEVVEYNRVMVVLVEYNRIMVVLVEYNRIVVMAVVVEYLESVIFLHHSHPLQILFFSVLFCTDDTLCMLNISYLLALFVGNKSIFIRFKSLCI